MISPTILASITKTDPNVRVAFQRRLANLETYITTTINPVEMEIIELKNKLIPLYDAAKILRDDAREFCTHSADLIIEQEDGSYKCKFCETIFHPVGDTTSNE